MRETELSLTKLNRRVVEGGLDFALHDEVRPGKPKRYEAEAQVTALACSAPSPGAQRWTIVLLTEAARRHPRLKGISQEAIRRILKKPPQTLAEADVVHWRTDRRVPPAHVRVAASGIVATSNVFFVAPASYSHQ